VERWRSQKDLDLHFEKPYFKDFTDKFPELLQEVETLNIYHVSEENMVA
jgi:quinol monooxygenase YgiN